jgi:hypothetical protein
MSFRVCFLVPALLFTSHPLRAEPCAPQDNAALAYWSVYAELDTDLRFALAEAARTATIDNVNDLPIWDELRRAHNANPSLPYWLDRAAARPCCDFGLDRLNGPLGLDRRRGMLRSMSNLAYLDALRRASESDAEGVAASLLTLLRLARHVIAEPDLGAASFRAGSLAQAAQIAQLDPVRELLTTTDLTILAAEINAIPIDDPAMFEAGVRGTASELAAFLRARFADPFTEESIDELCLILGDGIGEGDVLDAFLAAVERGTLLPEIDQYEHWMNACADAIASHQEKALRELEQAKWDLKHGPVTCIFGTVSSVIIRYSDNARDRDLPVLRGLVEPRDAE